MYNIVINTIFYCKNHNTRFSMHLMVKNALKINCSLNIYYKELVAKNINTFFLDQIIHILKRTLVIAFKAKTYFLKWLSNYMLINFGLRE